MVFCDVSAPVEPMAAGHSPTTGDAPEGGTQGGGSGARAVRMARLYKLAINNPALRAAIAPLLAPPSALAGDATTHGATATVRGGAALAQPLLSNDSLEAGRGAAEVVDAQTRCELALLCSACALPSLDVLVVLGDSDVETLRLCSLVTASTPILSRLHERQTATTQLVVRVFDAATEDSLASTGLCPPAYTVTALLAKAAVANLMAEALHPDCHWTQTLDNFLPSAVQADEA